MAISKGFYLQPLKILAELCAEELFKVLLRNFSSESVHYSPLNSRKTSVSDNSSAFDTFFCCTLLPSLSLVAYSKVLTLVTNLFKIKRT